MKLLPRVSPRTAAASRQDLLYRQLMREQAKMGGRLFGPIPSGHRREFFCLDRYTWVWHEEWIDAGGAQRVLTTRYDVRPQGILKSQGNNSYQRVRGEELKNLYQAAMLYRDSINAQVAELQRQV